MDRSLRNARRPAFDRLDARQLLAAHITATLAHGVLTVQGTAAADVIDVEVEHGVVAVAGLNKTFPEARIRRIVVLGGKGDDTIAVQGQGLPVRINGGPGNNTINGTPDKAPAPVAGAVVATPPAATSVAATPVATPVATTPVATTPVATPVATTPVATQPVAAPVATQPVATPAPTVADSVQRIIDLTNAQRIAAGLAPLTVDPALTEAATIQSDNMAQLEIMSHSLPGTDAPELTDRAALVGYQYAMLGENIAFNYADADAVVAGWMASPGHRANILNPGFTQIGVAIATDAQGEPYYTQEFGAPA